MRPVVLLSIALWAFAVSPMLCMGGMLSHACAPHQEAAEEGTGECADTYCDCESESDACSHESDCSSDPCRLDVTAKEPSRESVEQAVAPGDSNTALPCIVATELPEAHAAYTCGPPGESESRQIAPPIILPLLI